TSPSQTISLTNSGSAPLLIASVSISGDFAQSNNCGSTLVVNQSCSIRITFNPSVAGTRTGVLSISDNASVSPQTVSLTGVGLSIAISVSPTAFYFGTQGVASTSPARSFSVTNSGTGVLTISNIILAGGNGHDFAQTNNCVGSLASAAKCTINVTFTPSATGTRIAGLVIYDNAAGSPQIFYVAGTGVNGSLASTSPTSLAFGPQLIGTTSTVRPITLSNYGNAPLIVTTISPAGDFTETDNCSGAIIPGANCTISVTFSPVTIGTRSGALSITDNASGSPQMVTLTGIGTA